VLDDPQGKIIDRGGAILFVADAGEIVGCVALMALPDGGFEVAKMAVADSHKGRGLGRALMAACVERAPRRQRPRASTWRPTAPSPPAPRPLPQLRLPRAQRHDPHGQRLRPRGRLDGADALMAERKVSPARLEAISDGVIAVAITIMVLELHRAARPRARPPSPPCGPTS